MVKRILCAVALCALAACNSAPQKPDMVPAVSAVTVKVPVAIPRDVPMELKGFTVTPAELPTFVSPNDPKATSALTPEGEAKLLALLEKLRAQLEAWAGYAE